MAIHPLEIGFRFLPPDEEIIIFFLFNKMNGDDHSTRRIREVDLLQQEPWDLPDQAIVQSTYPEWMFFYKVKKEGKNDRLTRAGYWKSTGPATRIRFEGRDVGSKKTLVFYTGRTPCGFKTNWVMHEYHASPDLILSNEENCYVVGYLRHKAAENPENSISNYGEPNRQFGPSNSRNDAAGVASMEGDHILMSDGIGPSHSERFNMKRMENDLHQDDILVMGSGDYSATVTENETKVVLEEKSVNSRTCKSQYEPRSRTSVLQGQSKRVLLQGKSSGEAISIDKARKSGVRGPVAELVQNKISPLQSNQDRKMDQYRTKILVLKSRSNDSSGSGRKNSFNYLEESQSLSGRQNQLFECGGKVLLGMVLLIFAVEQLILIR